ncbi:MAG: cytochrome c maturation protein CcmE [Anaerolineales bacterium]|nr:cytochrome c maturation protein CcmE [Anaerolineales bacterium]
MRLKFILGGVAILAAIVFLIATSMNASAEYFLTVDEVQARQSEIVGRNLRISGAVIGDTISYEPDSLTLTFVIAHIPGGNREIEAQGGLALVLHEAVTDPTRTRLTVVYIGPKPDLLQDEAQAIVTGQLGDDGIFYADELLLKCPTRYEEALPEQALEN